MTLISHLQHAVGADRGRSKKLGYTSHQAGTCGSMFTSTALRLAVPSTQDAAIARTLFFPKNFGTKALKFSRRTQGQLNQWAAKYGYKDQPKEILDHAKAVDTQGRYTAVNLTNADTVEISDVPRDAQIQYLDCRSDCSIIFAIQPST